MKDTNPPFLVDWEEKITQEHLVHFEQSGFFVLDHVFAAQDFLSLQQESGFLTYKEAALTGGTRIESIRGDKIRWIDEQCVAGQAYVCVLQDLAKFFNRLYYLGINECEAHYACYPAGFGYLWHTDNPKGRDERVLSVVYYLNDDWAACDGGAIELIDKMDKNHIILPCANRLVVFDSNLSHQVQTTNRVRYSIAAWLRRY